MSLGAGSADGTWTRARVAAIALGGACGLAFVLLGVLVRDRVPALDRWALDSAVTDTGSVQERLATIMSAVAILFGFVVLAVVAVRARRQSRWLVRLSWCGALALARERGFRRLGCAKPCMPTGTRTPRQLLGTCGDGHEK